MDRLRFDTVSPRSDYRGSPCLGKGLRADAGDFPGLTGAAPSDRGLGMLSRYFSVPLFALAALALAMLGPDSAMSQQDATAPESIANPSGLPIPRWVSIRAKEANLRTGPGARYPIDWVLQRRNLPAEVIGEFENWRQIKVQDGTVGWVHKSMLSGKRMATVTSPRSRMRQSPDDRAPVAAFVENGVIVALNGCETTWCRVSIDSHGVAGWLPRSALWGIYDDETVGR